MARWEPRFDFYFSESAGITFSTFVDLEARAHAPVLSHPVALRGRLEMHNPRPDGLRSGAEAPALFEFEDRLVALLEEALDAIYVARVVGDGRTEFLLYLPPSTDSDPAAVAAALELYEVSFTRVLDRDWRGYTELYPDPRQRRQITDHHLLEVLESKGDRPELSRDVDHLVLFEERGPAELAARALADRGFAFFGEPVKERGAAYSVAFHRVETCRPADVRRFVDEILDIVLPLGGTYDGWGCEVQAHRAGPDGDGGR